jgi:hypothetical protein
MARPKGSKNKPKAEAEATDEQVKPGEVKQMISAGRLKKLLAAKRSTKKDVGELNGTLGQLLREAQENHNLHRKAFAVAHTLDMMENEKIRDFLDHLEYYLDISGIQKRADSVMKMDLSGEEGEGDDDDDGESNVVDHPSRAA